MKLNVRKKSNFYGTLIPTTATIVLVAFIYSLTEGIYSVGGNNGSQSTSFNVLLIFIILFALYSLYWLVRNFLISRSLNKRRKKLMLKAAETGMQSSTIKLSKTLELIAEDASKYRSHEVNNSYLATDWGYGEYQFTRYRRSKRSTYDTATFYFAVGVFTLPRKLPNVFFDSHKTGGREFKLLFDSSQKHSLESVFDNYFTAYFHEDYTIDNLSFITPEVMEALIAGQEYDIEIYEDKLYLYNELEDMPMQLDDIERIGKLIREKLLNNIITYRDQRIDYTDGRNTVSMLGVSLKRSLTWSYVKLVGASIGLIGAIIAGFIIGSSALSEVYLYALAFFGATAYRNYRKINRIKNEEEYARRQIATSA